MSEVESKRLSDLRVVDLKGELEKRGLDRTGKKENLVERLSKALKEEGKDPDTYLFESSDKKRRTSMQAEEEEKSEITEADSSGIEINTKTDKEKKEPEVKDEPTSMEEKPEEKQETVAQKPDEPQQNDHDGHEIPLKLTLDEEETLHDDEADTTTDKLSNEDGDDDKTNSSVEASKGDNKSKDSASTGQEGSKDEKEAGDTSSPGKTTVRKPKVPTATNPKVVWISNVTQNTRASEIKDALSSCGKVTGAKVVVNARFPGSCCFGYVTMATVEDADNVIAKLNNTELNGQIIKIEKFDNVREEQMKQMRSSTAPSSTSTTQENKSRKSVDKDEEKKPPRAASSTRSENDKSVKGDKKSPGKDAKENGAKNDKKADGDKLKHKSKEKSLSVDRSRRDNNVKRGRDQRDHKNRDVLTFDKIRTERERQRLREKERKLREESRRRHQEALRQRHVERHQRTEAQRLEREREKLKLEREKIEREKAELLKMERERQRLEREKIKAEKIELERTLIRLEEDRRASKRPNPFGRENYEERKKTVPDSHFKEAPPPPRFDVPSKVAFRLTYEGKHEATYPEKRSNSSRDYEIENRNHKGPMSRSSSSNISKYERPYESRERGDPRGSRDMIVSRSKDRYMERSDRDRSPHGFRGSIREDRDSRRMDSKSDMMSRDQRYQDSNPGKARFDRNNQWSSHSNSRSFNSSSGGNNDPWIKDNWRHDPSSDRWNNTPSSRSSNNQFSGNSNMGATCPPPPGLVTYPVRFDYNQKSMNSSVMRKY